MCCNIHCSTPVGKNTPTRGERDYVLGSYGTGAVVPALTNVAHHRAFAHRAFWLGCRMDWDTHRGREEKQDGTFREVVRLATASEQCYGVTTSDTKTTNTKKLEE